MSTPTIRLLTTDRSLLELLDTPLWRKYYALVRRRVRYPRHYKRTGNRYGIPYLWQINRP